jgi:hypothetical protein
MRSSTAVNQSCLASNQCDQKLSIYSIDVWQKKVSISLRNASIVDAGCGAIGKWDPRLLIVGNTLEKMMTVRSRT